MRFVGPVSLADLDFCIKSGKKHIFFFRSMAVSNFIKLGKKHILFEFKNQAVSGIFHLRVTM